MISQFLLGACSGGDARSGGIDAHVQLQFSAPDWPRALLLY